MPARDSVKRELGLIRSENVNVRLNTYELEALRQLAEKWGVSYSEALRRAVIYTYFKFLKGREVTEDELIRELVLSMLQSRP